MSDYDDLEAVLAANGPPPMNGARSHQGDPADLVQAQLEQPSVPQKRLLQLHTRKNSGPSVAELKAKMDASQARARVEQDPVAALIEQHTTYAPRGVVSQPGSGIVMGSQLGADWKGKHQEGDSDPYINTSDMTPEENQQFLQRVAALNGGKLPSTIQAAYNGRIDPKDWAQLEAAIQGSAAPSR